MPIAFETKPSSYRHWKLEVEGEIARLIMMVKPDGGLRDDYELKLNSYDLGVDIELADSVERIRFEHPQVKTVIVQSGYDRVFCAGANIHMLAGSTHAFKVNFCKYTNETRLSLEDASNKSGIKFLCAVAGPCAGGGYELALACDEILLVDDAASAVSLPEVPLLAVLPGTGGLTRLVDKRKVRRDLADVFCTTSEGLRGKKAVEWGLVDATAPRSKFEDAVNVRAKALVDKVSSDSKWKLKSGAQGVELESIAPKVDSDGGVQTIEYRYLSLRIEEKTRVASITLRGPNQDAPKSAADLEKLGTSWWSLRAFRELDDALIRLRLEHLETGVIVFKSEGDLSKVAAHDAALVKLSREHWFANEVLLKQARVLRRVDLTSKSMFALIDQGSCFAGSLFEIALGCDRIYMLADDDGKVAIQITEMNSGVVPMSHGHSRLETRFLGSEGRAAEVKVMLDEAIPTERAEELGLVTFAPDEIDWDDDVRIAIEERASLSPDALTGMEASLRFPGSENGDSKIFGRLSAWQNWIFQRPNAVGPTGALTKYGEPERPSFNFTRC